MDYQTAVGLLQRPETWCRGAEALAQLGDVQALLPLIQAYEQRYEGSKVCLLEAMRALDAERGAGILFDAAQSPDQQRLAAHLMELFPEDAHLARLERAAASGEAGVRYQAGRALVCQRQSDTWEQIMRQLLAADDERVRSWAIEGLGYSRRESARRALADRLAHEPSAALRKKLEKLLNT